MKGMLLAATAVAALGLGVSGAMAADGTALLAQCEANADAGQMPPNTSAEAYMKFCECLVTKAGDNQALIDEHLAIASASAEEIGAKIEASSQQAKDNGAACQAEAGITPPAPPPAQ